MEQVGNKTQSDKQQQSQSLPPHEEQENNVQPEKEKEMMPDTVTYDAFVEEIIRRSQKKEGIPIFYDKDETKYDLLKSCEYYKNSIDIYQEYIEKNLSFPEQEKKKFEQSFQMLQENQQDREKLSALDESVLRCLQESADCYEQKFNRNNLKIAFQNIITETYLKQIENKRYEFYIDPFSFNVLVKIKQQAKYGIIDISKNPDELRQNHIKVFCRMFCNLPIKIDCQAKGKEQLFEYEIKGDLKKNKYFVKHMSDFKVFLLGIDQFQQKYYKFIQQFVIDQYNDFEATVSTRSKSTKPDQQKTAKSKNQKN
ncbi:hypothetical protein ABPG72_017737 [Tetrahymena utriculariae]